MQIRSYTTKATNLKINEEVSNREYSREFKNTEQRNNIKYGKMAMLNSGVSASF